MKNPKVEGQRSAGTANDQGQPAEEATSDPAVDGGGVAVEQEGTVAVDADPTNAKGKETGEGNPYADLLKEYVPQKDYVHAQRKITEQGQTISARDAEMTQLRADVQKLESQITRNSLRTEDDGYGADEDAVDGSVISELQQIKADIAAQNERLNAQEDVIISSATETQRTRGVQTVKQNLGLNDEMALAVQTLKEQGDMDGAIALAGKAAVIAKAEIDKEVEAQKAEPILTGNESNVSVDAEEPEHKPLTADELPEDMSKWDGFRLNRIKKALGL